MRIAAGIFVALMVSGCTTTTLLTGTQANISPKMVYELKAGYDVVRVGLVAYRELPWCTSSPAPCQTVVVARQIKQADSSAMLALGKLETFSRAHDTIDLPAAYEAAQEAVAVAKQIAVTYNIK